MRLRVTPKNSKASDFNSINQQETQTKANLQSYIPNYNFYLEM